VSVNYAQLRNVTARELISALIRDGFSYDRGDGRVGSRAPQDRQ